MSEAEDRARVIRHWLSRSRESLESARDELAASRNLITLGRIYHAVFHAASAALLAEGHSFVKHSGVRAGVNRHLVRTGKPPSEMGRFYNQSFDERHDADYEAFYDMESPLVRERIDTAETFIAHITRLLGNTAT